MLQLVTLAQLAEAAGVAKSTVSLALRDSPKVIVETRNRIKQLATEMGYRPNPLVAAQMSHIRHTRRQRTATTIGFLSTWLDEEQHKRLRWSIMGRYFKGAKARAEELGLEFDLFEFDREKYSDTRIQEILHSRHIDGVVLAPLKYSHSRIELDWSEFALSAIGYYNAYGNIHRVFYDSFDCMQKVLNILVDRGYQRIGFITNKETEARSAYHWSGSFLEFQSRVLEDRYRVPLLRQENQESQFTVEDYDKIRYWYTTHRPDVIISFLDKTLNFLKSEGYVPNQDFGYVALSWSDDMGGCTGYQLSLEKVGATAVDLVADSLYRNDRGMPAYPYTTLLFGTFIEGNTLRLAK
jgi:LacI family transcriptional regulator